MASLRREIRQMLKQLLEEHENEETPSELLRMVQEEAGLLQETEQVKDALRLDPFECLKSVRPSSLNRLFQLLEVTECHRVHTKSGYCHIKATCRFNADGRMKTRGIGSCIELNFHYERQGDPSIEKQPDDNSMVPSVSYSIDLSRDHGPSEKMLWVHVYTADHKPPPHNAPAINMMEEGEEWEDMDEEDEEAAVAAGKSEDDDDDDNNKVEPDSLVNRTRDSTTAIEEKEGRPQRSRSNHNVDMKTSSNEGDEEMVLGDDVARFLAGMDPDVVAHFLQWSLVAGDMEDDMASFYLIMTFPFYEFEFDLLGYLLEGVFGKDDHGGSGDDHGGSDHDE